jgi:hypothetical protein
VHFKALARSGGPLGAKGRTHGCPERLIQGVCEKAAVDAVEDAEEDGGDGVDVHGGCACPVVCTTRAADPNRRQKGS